MRNRATFIASLLLLAACSKEEAPVRPEDRTIYEPPTSEPAAAEKPGVRYEDVTREAGIEFEHVSGAYGRTLLPETMGSGVGIFDYDGDGKLDLLFLQSRYWEGHIPEGKSQPTMRLYRNLGKWRFLDVTKAAGLDVVCYGMGCAIADYDADGDPDLYVTCLGSNLLFRNQGGRFEQVPGPDGGTWTDANGVRHHSWSTGAAWLDADGDDDLDLVVVSYVQWTPETDVEQTVTGTEKAYTRPQLYVGDYPRLYLQQADGTFTDATEKSGLAKAGDPGKSMAVCIDDCDDDGNLDLFVANDTVQNFLYLGDGKGAFRECALDAAVAYDDKGQARAGMGTDSVDWRNDGRISFVIGNFTEEPVSVYTVSRLGGETPVFRDDAKGARIVRGTLPSLTFGLLLTDVDLDGWADLVLANGHIEPSISIIKHELRYAQPAQLFRNMAGRRFADVSVDAGSPFRQEIVGRGLAAGDLDGDGDLDLVFTSNGTKPRYARPLLLRNDLRSNNRSLRIRLRQEGKNRDALGAIVRVTANGVTQRRMVRTGGSYLSQGDLTLTFGLGGAKKAEKVSLRWPDGTLQEAGELGAGSHLIERSP